MNGGSTMSASAPPSSASSACSIEVAVEVPLTCGDHGNTSVDESHDVVEDGSALLCREGEALAGHPEDGDAVHAGGELEFDQAAQTRAVEGARLVERRRQDGHQALECRSHRLLPRFFIVCANLASVMHIVR